MGLHIKSVMPCICCDSVNVCLSDAYQYLHQNICTINVDQMAFGLNALFFDIILQEDFYIIVCYMLYVSCVFFFSKSKVAQRPHISNDGNAATAAAACKPIDKFGRFCQCIRF